MNAKKTREKNKKNGETMTNREKIFKRLAELDNKQLASVIDNITASDDLLDDLFCKYDGMEEGRICNKHTTCFQCIENWLNECGGDDK